MKPTIPAAELIRTLSLEPHPEGGFYRETYRSADCLADPGERFSGPRSASTGIYYLLQKGDFSAFHRIRSDEMWHFYEGHPLFIHMLDPVSRAARGIRLGEGLCYQAVVPAGMWFAAEPEGEYSLVGCTVAPGFDFADFEIGGRSDLMGAFPNCRDLVGRLTR